MRKIIDIPDGIVKELKILAVKNDSDLKNYIQDLVSRHYELSNITEMASYAVEDGQSMRFVWNYLVETYQGLKDEKFDYGDFQFGSLIEFLEFVKETCSIAVESIKNDSDYEEGTNE